MLDILSGSLKMKDRLRDGNVVMLSGMLGDYIEKNFEFDKIFLSLLY